MNPQDDDNQLQDKVERLLQLPRPRSVAQKAPEGIEQDYWRGCLQLAEKYDQDMCEAYREQIDTLLVFAGLFSAVVTAFTVESYRWLSVDAEDVTAQLLARIAASVTQNGSETLPPLTTSSVLSGSSSTRINTYWFLSLTLNLSANLSAALIGILAKQWVREYARDAGRSSPEALRVRQMKFEGFNAWKVSEIVSAVPMLIQAALALFLIGILELLWGLNVRVAIPVTVVSSAAGLFYLATAILPSLNFIVWYFTPAFCATQCPYKSPQSWLLLRGVHAVVTHFNPRKLNTAVLNLNISDGPAFFAAKVAFIRGTTSWIDFDLAWTSLSDDEDISRPEHRYSALAWLRRTLGNELFPVWVWHCLWDTVASGPISSRFDSNVMSLVEDPTLLEKAYMPHWDALIAEKPGMKPSCLLLLYLFRTPQVADRVVGLLCDIYLREQGRLAAPSKLLNAFAMDWLCTANVYMQDGPISREVSDQLLLMMYQISRAEQANPDLGRALLHACELACPRDLSDTAVPLALCTITRQWIQADVPLDAEALFRRVDEGLSMLAYLHNLARDAGVHDVAGLGHGPVCLLARAIADAWHRTDSTLEQYLQATRPPAMVDAFSHWVREAPPANVERLPDPGNWRVRAETSTPATLDRNASVSPREELCGATCN